MLDFPIALSPDTNIFVRIDRAAWPWTKKKQILLVHGPKTGVSERKYVCAVICSFTRFWHVATCPIACKNFCFRTSMQCTFMLMHLQYREAFSMLHAEQAFCNIKISRHTTITAHSFEIDHDYHCSYLMIWCCLPTLSDAWLILRIGMKSTFGVRGLAACAVLLIWPIMLNETVR